MSDSQDDSLHSYLLNSVNQILLYFYQFIILIIQYINVTFFEENKTKFLDNNNINNNNIKDTISSTSWIIFDDFQIKLFKGFTFILCANIGLIYISWKFYGKKISEKFMKPATSKTIEELKKSVSSLKLPKEHSPRV